MITVIYICIHFVFRIDRQVVGNLAFGDIVESTGEVQDVNGIQRLRISQGWISMNLREANGTVGAPVVERID
jgi:hypothetical protein